MGDELEPRVGKLERNMARIEEELRGVQHEFKKVDARLDRIRCIQSEVVATKTSLDNLVSCGKFWITTLIGFLGIITAVMGVMIYG